MNIIYHPSIRDKECRVGCCTAQFEPRGANQSLFEHNQVDGDEDEVGNYDTHYADELTSTGPCNKFVVDKLNRIQTDTESSIHTRRSFAHSQHQSQLSLCTFAATDVQRALSKTSTSSQHCLGRDDKSQLARVASNPRNNRYHRRAGVTLHRVGVTVGGGGIGNGLQASDAACINSNGHLKRESNVLGQELSRRDHREGYMTASTSSSKLHPLIQASNYIERGNGNNIVVVVAEGSAIADSTRSSASKAQLSSGGQCPATGEGATGARRGVGCCVERSNRRMGWNMKQAKSFRVLPPQESIYESPPVSSSSASELSFVSSSSSSVSLKQQKLPQVYAESDSGRCAETNNQLEQQSPLPLPASLFSSSASSSTSKLFNKLGWRSKQTTTTTAADAKYIFSNEHSNGSAQLSSGETQTPATNRVLDRPSSFSDLIDAVRSITQQASSIRRCEATFLKQQQQQVNSQTSKSSSQLDQVVQEEEEQEVIDGVQTSSTPHAKFFNSTNRLNNLLDLNDDASNKAIEIPYYSKILYQPKHLSTLARERTPRMMHSSVHSLSMQLDQATMRQQLHCTQNQSSIGVSSAMNTRSVSQSPVLSQSVLEGLNVDQLATSQSSANKLGRLVGKKAARIKEIVLQNLGRAEKTTDELFELYEENFFKQHSKTTKLSKEFKNYMNALKGFHDARRSLNKCIQNATSDYQSARHDLVCENLSQLEQLNGDLVEKLREQVTGRLNEYLTQFNELKEKVSKRRRKMIDYDSSRRAYELFMNDISKKRQRQQRQQQQGSNSKRSDGVSGTLGSVNDGSTFDLTSQLFDEARLLKLREQFNYCKIMYESINGELHEELPVVYEKRMKHLLKALQSYFELEAHYYSNASKLSGTASEVIDELPTLPIASSNAGAANRKKSTGVTDRNDPSESKYTDSSHCSTTIVVSPQSGICGGSSGVGSSRGESSPDSTSEGSGAGEAAIHTDEARAESRSSSSSSSEEDETDAPCTQVTDAIIVVDGPEAGKESAPLQQETGNEGVAAAPCEPVPNAQEPCADESTVCSLDSANELSVSLKEATKPMEESQSTGAEKEPEEENVGSETESKPTAELEASEPKQSTKPMEEEEKEKGSSIAVVAKDKIESKQYIGKALYKVKSNYKYLAEDVDELCFEPDEIIQVVEFDPEHEPEEGWLMGVREVNGQRGLFPANFTQPL